MMGEKGKQKAQATDGSEDTGSSSLGSVKSVLENGIYSHPLSPNIRPILPINGRSDQRNVRLKGAASIVL